MPSKKIVCLGAASKNFAGMYRDIITRRQLQGSEIVLYDIDKDGKTNLTVIFCSQSG